MHLTSKSYLTSLKIIYMAMVSTMTLFTVITLLLVVTESIHVETDEKFATLMRYILIALVPVGIGAGYFVFKQSISTALTLPTLKEKLLRYQVAVLMRAACMEIPGLFAAVATLITGDLSFLLFAALIIVLFLILLPAIGAIVQDLNLSQHEKAILENPNATL
ncbi:MAG: hypothetical protein MUF39_01115 [Cyclobacteriaceae bacterium]|nr:hypothetical protein [Cyclobacteriaceae bacterium]